VFERTANIAAGAEASTATPAARAKSQIGSGKR